MAQYISSVEDVAALRNQMDSAGQKLVFTNGCFDLLHVGHVRYLREARALGDKLVVAMNDDASVKALKGEGRPVYPAADRAEILCALESVDAVVVFTEPRVTRLIDAIRPHIYAKGGDYTVETLNPDERAALDRAGSDIRILSLVEGRSTSRTMAKLRSSEMEEERLRIAVFGSGDGSNFAAISAEVEKEELEADIRMVISDIKEAGILDLGRTYGIPAIYVDPGDRRGVLSPAAEKEIIDRLRGEDVDLIVLAGFMRLIKGPVLAAFKGRILNVQPSLLPQFPGLDAPKQAIEAGVTETGCTIHIVDEGVDSGPILAQARVPVLPDDTPKTLHARIKVEEHRLYPQVIADYGAKVMANRANP